MKAYIGCSSCGRRIRSGNSNGMPNAIGFVQADGTLVNLCQQCIIELGKMSDKNKDEFLEGLGLKK